MATTGLYQHSTVAALKAGVTAGNQTLATLLTHGDTGIGTADRAAGDVTILDGQAYQSQANGKTKALASSAKIPFAMLHANEPTIEQTFENVDYRVFEQQLLSLYPYKNLLVALRVTGTFTTVDLSVKRAEPAADDSTYRQFTGHNVTGTLVGYYVPTVYHGVTQTGFHLHFLNQDKTFGGHVTGYRIDTGLVQLQALASLQVVVPTHDTEFLNRRQ
ncbi:acetolactate decarboxylase [Lactiplantibacillus daowaiensis]|uniref:Alpha-acetolactate decarboxylase n=1 Tax=Lactiplantibacillus daowaiensis TaxID=2559918 RepID=A0ABW1RZ05_9LACO|nr:acetolactate decarboxylase [Lactiplantibacillus daowaiensis]